jgi:hypothetical protein
LTALLLADWLGGGTPGLVAALLFLVQFNVSNFYLSGLVDSAEVFFMTLTATTLRHRKWSMLPVVAVAGAFARETFVPLMALLAGGWFLGLSWSERRISQAFSVGVAAVAGFFALAVIRMLVDGHMVWPWQIASDDGSFSMVLPHAKNLLGRPILYTFIWLGPLGLMGMKYVDRRWAVGSIVAFAGATFLAAWGNAGDNVGRPLFSAAGPFLVCASALWLIRWLGNGNASRSR